MLLIAAIVPCRRPLAADGDTQALLDLRGKPVIPIPWSARGGGHGEILVVVAPQQMPSKERSRARVRFVVNPPRRRGKALVSAGSTRSPPTHGRTHRSGRSAGHRGDVIRKLRDALQARACRPSYSTGLGNSVISHGGIPGAGGTFR